MDDLDSLPTVTPLCRRVHEEETANVPEAPVLSLEALHCATALGAGWVEVTCHGRREGVSRLLCVASGFGLDAGDLLHVVASISRPRYPGVTPTPAPR